MCPKIHRWANLREPLPSLPWETLESQYKVYVYITFELTRPCMQGSLCDQQVQLAIGGKGLIRYPVDDAYLVRWCPTYLGNSQRPHHLYTLPKINKRDVYITYYPTTYILRGFEES